MYNLEMSHKDLKNQNFNKRNLHLATQRSTIMLFNSEIGKTNVQFFQYAKTVYDKMSMLIKVLYVLAVIKKHLGKLID